MYGHWSFNIDRNQTIWSNSTLTYDQRILKHLYCTDSRFSVTHLSVGVTPYRSVSYPEPRGTIRHISHPFLQVWCDHDVEMFKYLVLDQRLLFNSFVYFLARRNQVITLNIENNCIPQRGTSTSFWSDIDKSKSCLRLLQRRTRRSP